MGTNVNLDEDVAAAVEQLRAKDGMGHSEALNRLVRAGASLTGVARHPFVQPTFDMGPMLDVSKVTEALEFTESN